MVDEIYVNWDKREVITNADEWIEARAKEIAEDTEVFCDYLDGRYTLDEVFYLSEDEKNTIMDEFMASCHEDAEVEFDENFEEWNIQDDG